MLQGFTPPVFVEHLGDAIHDAVGAGLVGEEVVHGPGAPAHLPEGPLQDVRGPDGFLQDRVKGKIMKAVKEVFFHTPDGSLFFHLPPGLPVFKAFDGLLAAVGGKDQLGESPLQG